ncbi:MAG TPA: hypothetical protein VK849_07630, partial [Longimicrobiales bacterium]|nr:hypothetical protein [Longimicrobiales bacterium]
MTTFQALSHAGAVVMVHFLPAGEGARRIRQLMDGLEEAEQSRILESAEVDGTPAVVTKFVMDFVSLEAWLREHQSPSAGRAPAPSAPPPPPPAPAPPSGIPEPPAPSGPASAPGEPGEFTRLF